MVLVEAHEVYIIIISMVEYNTDVYPVIDTYSPFVAILYCVNA